MGAARAPLSSVSGFVARKWDQWARPETRVQQHHVCRRHSRDSRSHAAGLLVQRQSGGEKAAFGSCGCWDKKWKYPPRAHRQNAHIEEDPALAGPHLRHGAAMAEPLPTIPETGPLVQPLGSTQKTGKRKKPLAKRTRDRVLVVLSVRVALHSHAV